MGWGDEIMVTGIARRMQESNGRQVRVQDRRGRARWSEIWAGNPRLAPPGGREPVQVLVNGPGSRPYIARETERRWIWREWICPVGELHLTAVERAVAMPYAGRVILEPGLKAQASPNKDWGWANWAALAERLGRQGHRVAQLGPAGTRLLPGVELIRTGSFRTACAVLARARLAVLPEGGLHHAAAALGTPSIVLFGGFISPAQTGYSHQVNLVGGGAPCGMRVRCRHCAEAMRRIGVDAVEERARALIAAAAMAD